MEVKKPYVFISYSRKDYIDDENKNIIPDNTITKILEALDKAKINYWIDLEGIYSGDAFAPIIGEAIENCDVFLFVSSKNSKSSKWTISEIATAQNFEKKIIPFKIDDSPFAAKIALYTAHLDINEYYKNQDKGLERLVNDINAHFNNIEEEARKAKEEEDRRKEAERQKEEEEKRRKELEEKKRKEAQKRIVTEIKVKCRKLNNDETKLETDRDTLLASTAMISDEAEREKVKSYIASSSPLRKKVEDEMDALRKQVDELENEKKKLTTKNEELIQTNAEIANTNKDLTKKLNYAEATAKEATRNHPSKLLEEKDSSIQYWQNESEKWKKEYLNYKNYKGWWEYRWQEWKKARNWKLFWFILLILLIGTGVFFWWHGNMKFFFPREPRVKTEVSVEAEVEMDSCFVGKSAEELCNEGWDCFYGRNGKTQDTMMAFNYMKTSAELGYDWGMAGLGWYYKNGYGVERDYEEAVKWYRKSAEQGNLNAQSSLGEMYYYGYGVKQNYKEAVKWYREAADKGYPTAQINVGFMYDKGYGVEQNKEEAVKWYKLSAAQGDEDAKNKLKELGVSEE